MCPSCADKARRLRMHQCREGWHLTDEPPHPANDDQVESFAEQGTRIERDLLWAHRQGLKVPDYVLADAALSYKKDNTTLSLNVSNIFDKLGVSSRTAATEQNPRHVEFGQERSI